MLEGGIRTWALVGVLPLTLVGCPGNSSGTVDAGGSIGPSAGSNAGGSNGSGGDGQADASSPDASDGGGSGDGGTGAASSEGGTGGEPNGTEAGSTNRGGSASDAAAGGDASQGTAGSGASGGAQTDGGTAGQQEPDSSASNDDTVEYYACSNITGGSTTIGVRRFDSANSTCIQVVLVAGGSCPFQDSVETDSGLCIERVRLQRDVDACGNTEPQPVEAVAVTGSIESSGQAFDLDLTLQFPGQSGGTETLDVEVSGCTPSMACETDCRQ